MPSLLEQWRNLRRETEEYIRARSQFGTFIWTLEDPPEGVSVNVLDRTDDGWADRAMPMGPFLASGMVSFNQHRARRYRYGSGGRVVVDLPLSVGTTNVDPMTGARVVRSATRTTSDRNIIDRLGIDVPDGYSTSVASVTVGAVRVGWAVLANMNGARCCSCREVNGHTCCRRNSGYSRYCNICETTVEPAGTNGCVCPDRPTVEAGNCRHDWDAVEINSYSRQAPSGFRSLSAGDGTVLWSSRPSVDVPYYLGIEWEVGAEDEQIQQSVLRTLTDTPWVTSQGVFPLIIKSDSSVEGQEVCFSPMTPGAAMAFPWDEMAANFGRSGDEPTGHGVHVHVSETAFSDRDVLRRWIDLVNITSRPLAEAVARRRDSSWGRFNRRRANESGESQNGRYSAVNVYTGHSTHEVRIFRSANTGADMRAIIAYVTATVDYIRQGGDAMDAHAFHDYMRGTAHMEALDAYWPAVFPAPRAEAPTVPNDITASDPWAVVVENTSAVSSGSFRIRLDRDTF